jgi:FeS assembly SUF system regulator
MLKISKLTDYATIIMSHLALTPTTVFSAARLAKETHLAPPTARKILKILAEANLVTSFRGTDGGYQLARSADSMTLADVVEAIEGKLAMTECCSVSNYCTLDSLCTVKENWQVINHIILKALRSFTLSDMNKPLYKDSRGLNGIPIQVMGAQS